MAWDEIAPRILESASGMSPWTALGVAALLVLVAVLRSWQSKKEAKDELVKAEKEYRDAVASRDIDRIRIATRRLRNAQVKAE